MKKLFLIFISLMIFPIYALQLDNDIEKGSYVLGVAEGKIMKENFLDIENPRKLKIFDLEAYLAGISDSYQRKNLAYKKKDLLDARLRFFQALRYERLVSMAEENPQASYSMGVLKGEELWEGFGIFAKEENSFNLENFKAGFSDAFLERELLIKEEEFPKIIQKFLSAFQKATSNLIKQFGQ